MALQDLTPQLRTRLRRVEKIVGLFVTIAALTLLAGFGYYLFATAARKGWFIPKAHYYTFVMSAEGLNVGDAVLLMGFKVGQITVIEAQPPGSYYKVFIGFEIRRPYYGYIWADSKVRIAPTDLLGRRNLEVLAGYAGAPTVYEKNNRPDELLIEGKKVPVALASKGVSIEPLEDPTMTDRVQKLITQAELAMPNILTLTNQIYRVMTNAVALTAHLDEMLVSTKPLLTNLTVITANLRDPHGSLGEWIIPTNINTQLTATLGTANTTLGSANATVTNANAQITLLAASLNQTLLNVSAITSNLNIQVQSNDQILSEISRLVIETDEMLQGLKRHWLLKSAFPTPPGADALKPILDPQLALPPGGGKR